MKYKIIFCYDGTAYYGYAKQSGYLTIQETIEKFLSKILNQEISIYSSGRTDKNVHALNQVADFKTNSEIKDLSLLQYSLNRLLPDDIYIKSIKLVDDNFSSRLSAKKKVYQYIINIGEYDPFKRNFEINLTNLDLKKMEKASKLFIGTHNFMNFTSKEEDGDNFIRTIYSIDFIYKDNRLIIETTGNGFMRYQVRKIVGTLIEIGKNKISEQFIIDNLNAKERNIIPFTALPKGLFLKEVIY